MTQERFEWAMSHLLSIKCSDNLIKIWSRFKVMYVICKKMKMEWLLEEKVE